MAQFGILRRDRRGDPTAPAAGSAGADRFLPLRGGDAGHQWRVRHRRGARTAGGRAGVVSRYGKPRRGHLPAASPGGGAVMAREGCGPATAGSVGKRTPALDGGAAVGEILSGRSVPASPHAVPSDDPVAGHALRISLQARSANGSTSAVRARATACFSTPRARTRKGLSAASSSRAGTSRTTCSRRCS